MKTTLKMDKNNMKTTLKMDKNEVQHLMINYAIMVDIFIHDTPVFSYEIA